MTTHILSQIVAILIFLIFIVGMVLLVQVDEALRLAPIP